MRPAGLAERPGQAPVHERRPHPPVHLRPRRVGARGEIDGRHLVDPRPGRAHRGAAAGAVRGRGELEAEDDRAPAVLRDIGERGTFARRPSRHSSPCWTSGRTSR